MKFIVDAIKADIKQQIYSAIRPYLIEFAKAIFSGFWGSKDGGESKTSAAASRSEHATGKQSAASAAQPAQAAAPVEPVVSKAADTQPRHAPVNEDYSPIRVAAAEPSQDWIGGLLKEAEAITPDAELHHAPWITHALKEAAKLKTGDDKPATGGTDGAGLARELPETAKRTVKAERPKTVAEESGGDWLAHALREAEKMGLHTPSTRPRPREPGGMQLG